LNYRMMKQVKSKKGEYSALFSRTIGTNFFC
jgi:hypothetical protein